MIRFFDVVLSTLILLLFSPILVTISLLIVLESKGGIIFKQARVGQYGNDFYIYKFRTMSVGSSSKGLLTIGERDARLTKIGYFLRRYKLDEMPQFINVIKGDMNIVGPRPEVRKYVNFYTEEQKKVLTVKPGITDYASIKYKNENKLLADSPNPEEYYIKIIMQDKLKCSLEIVNNLTIRKYFEIILQTLYTSLFR